ncbi:MAG: Crp/Fnr family transcriptional regulator [Prevotella sp.]|nr:Crp/Fnr family transcriptional regulator [Prevotella sp.]
MASESIFSTLTKSALFAGLSSDAISELFIHVNYKVTHMRRNEIYTFAGMEHFYATIVLRGRMQAYMVSHTGKSVRVSSVEAGEMIAPALLFSASHVMPVTVKADSETSILQFGVNYLERFIAYDVTVRHNFIGILSSIVTTLQRKIHELTMLPAKERIAHYLLRTAREQGSKVITLSNTRQELADSFGIQKYSLNRCLGQLVAQGLISVEGKKVTLLDVRALKGLT